MKTQMTNVTDWQKQNECVVFPSHIHWVTDCSGLLINDSYLIYQQLVISLPSGRLIVCMEERLAQVVCFPSSRNSKSVSDWV